MKRVISYTCGWDPIEKVGYLTAIDETQNSHAIGNLSKEEFRIMYDLLKEDEVYVDKHHWFVSGWDLNKH